MLARGLQLQAEKKVFFVKRTQAGSALSADQAAPLCATRILRQPVGAVKNYPCDLADPEGQGTAIVPAQASFEDEPRRLDLCTVLLRRARPRSDAGEAYDDGAAIVPGVARLRGVHIRPAEPQPLFVTSYGLGCGIGSATLPTEQHGRTGFEDSMYLAQITLPVGVHDEHVQT